VAKRRRLSLSVRLQPYEGTTLAEVVEWLNSMERDEMSRLLNDALVMAYLPYARKEVGETKDEIERCCWETQDRLMNHGFNMRQALRVAQPQFDKGSGMVMPSIPVLEQKNNSPTELNESPIEDDLKISYKSNESARSRALDLSNGSGSVSDVDAVFGDDDG
jgi:hypothetical protein